jgi:hypothetical protein
MERSGRIEIIRNRGNVLRVRFRYRQRVNIDSEIDRSSEIGKLRE